MPSRRDLDDLDPKITLLEAIKDSRRQRDRKRSVAVQDRYDTNESARPPRTQPAWNGM